MRSRSGSNRVLFLTGRDRMEIEDQQNHFLVKESETYADIIQVLQKDCMMLHTQYINVLMECASIARVAAFDSGGHEFESWWVSCLNSN